MHPAFQVHALNEAGWERAQHIAQSFDHLLADVLPHLGPPSRESSIVVTKLEEACFFAKKAMASRPENQL